MNSNYVEKLYRLMYYVEKEFSILNIENFIYSDIELEKESPNIYYLLVSLDFKKNDIKKQIKEILLKNFSYLEYKKWKKRELLGEICNESVDLIYALRELNMLSLELNDKELIIFIGYLSELDDVPLKKDYYKWNSEFLDSKLKKIEVYKNEIEESARQILFKNNN
jgi:hypothetical protein